MSENKLSGLRREMSASGNDSIQENDKYRLQWDIFVIVLAIYNWFSVPFNIAF